MPRRRARWADRRDMAPLLFGKDSKAMAIADSDVIAVLFHRSSASLVRARDAANWWAGWIGKACF